MDKTNRINGLPPLCKKYGTELTTETTANKELVARKNVMDKLAMILTSRDHNNAIITGKAGTGKTALVKAFAAEVHAGTYEALAGRQIVEISLDYLLKDVLTPNERGAKLANLLKEAAQENIILFVDEGHRLYGQGDSDSLGNAAKPYLTRGDMQLILATTKEEYKKYIAKDSALQRRFEEVYLPEPDLDETTVIMQKVLSKRISWLQDYDLCSGKDR